MALEPLTVAAAARAYPGEAVSGDAWGAFWHGGICHLAVIDGLGHGPLAAAAARAALETLANLSTLGPGAALHRCHEALHGTRGAAISLAWIDPAGRRLTFGGVGNVEVVLWQAGQPLWRPIAFRGIVGVTLPRIRCFEYGLPDDWLLLLHTDGVSTRFDLAALVGQHGRDPQVLADAVLAGWARPTDDATVVVIGPPRPAPPPAPPQPEPGTGD